MKPMYALFNFDKRVSNQPNTHTAMESLCRSYVIKKIVSAIIKVLYIQRVFLQLILTGNKFLNVAYYQEKILHIHIQ